MSDARKYDDNQALNRETQEIWDRNAEWWDERTGEGDDFQRILIRPAAERLLDLHPGELVLDCACGNGSFSRRMASLGANVVAFDFSAKFLERARSRTVELADRIEYQLIDATDESQLLQLGKRRFDAAVCNMALMDMSKIDPLVSALSQLLKTGGRFVFSVLHPCFNNSTGCRMSIEEEDKDGELVVSHAVKVVKYIQPSVAKGIGIVGQPAAQNYYHRPLSLLLGTCFRAGFVLDGLEEPIFDQPVVAERPFAWVNFKEIPPVVVARLRLARQAAS